MEYEQKCLDRDWDKKCCDWDRGYDQDYDLDYDWIMIRQSYFSYVYNIFFCLLRINGIRNKIVLK